MSNAPFRTIAQWSAIIAIGLGALVMGMTLFSGFMMLAVITGGTFCALWMGVAWFALKWRNETTATRICLAASIVAGVIGMLLSSLLTRWITGSNSLLDSALPSAMSTTLSSAVLGAPPGLVFGALFALPIRRVHRLCRDRAIEATDRALRVCGIWLFAVSMCCVGLDLLAMPSLDSPAWAVWSLFGGTLGIATMAGLVVLVTHLRISRRKRWFERVQAGTEPGWTIVPRSSVADELEDLSPLFVSGATCNVVLVQHEAIEGGGAYRTASNLLPFALVHLPEGLAAMSFSLPNDEERISAI